MLKDHEKKEEGKRKKKKEKKEKENIGIGNFLKHYHKAGEPQVFWGWRNQGSLFLKRRWYFILEEQKIIQTERISEWLGALELEYKN